MTADLEFHEPSGLWVRPDTRDAMIANEVLVEQTYGMARLRADDRVLDIGANIGAATRFFLDHGVRDIVAYEPDLDNCRMFERNVLTEDMDGVELVKAAITRETGPVTLYTNNGPNKACHSLVRKKGYTTSTVQGVALERVLDDVDPTVVKCDIEGGEYLLPWEVIEQRENIRVVIIELHTQKPEMREYLAPALMALMQTMGFSQVTNVSNEFKSNWPKRVIWERRSSASVTS